jgi:chromosome segregation ATPase
MNFSRCFSLKNIFTLAILFTITYSDASPSRDAWNLWRKGFNVYEDGEDMMLQGKNIEALTNFKTAFGHFSKISKDNPTWKTKLIKYRLGLCRRKISSLNKKIAESTGTGTQSNSALISKAIQSTLLEKLQIEVDLYKNKFYTTSAELELAKRDAVRNKVASDQLPVIIKEKSELAVKLSLLEKQYKNLALATNDKTQADENMDLKIDAIKAQLSTSNLQIDKLNAQLAELKESNKQFEVSNRLIKAEVLKEQKLGDSFKQKTFTAQKILAQVEKERGSLKSEIAILREKQVQLTNLLNKKDTAIVELENQLAELMDKSDVAGVTNQLRSENARLNNTKKKLSVQVNDLEREKADLKKNLSQSVVNIVELSENYKKQKIAAEKSAQELSKIVGRKKVVSEQAKVNTSMLKTFQTENKKLREELTELGQNFKKLKIEADIALNQHQKVNADFAQRESKLKQKLVHANTKLTTLLNKKPVSDEQKKLLARLDQVSAMNNELSKLQQDSQVTGGQLKLLLTEKNRLELEYLALQAQVKDAPNTSKTVYAAKHRFTKELQELRSQLQVAQKEVIQLKSRVKKSSSKSLLQANEKEIDELKNDVLANSGKVTQLTLANAELTAQLREAKQSMPKLDTPGAIASDSKLLTQIKAEAASKKKLRALTSKYESKLKEAATRRKKLDKKLTQSVTMANTYKANLTNLTERLQAMKEKVQTANSTESELAVKAKTSVAEVRRLTTENKRLEFMVNKLDLEKVIADNNHFKQNIKKMKIEQLALTQQVDELKAIKVNPDVALLVKKMERKNTAIDELIVQIEELKDDNDGLSASFEDIDRKLYKRNEKLMQYKEWLDTKSKNFDALTDRKKVLEQELKELKGKQR